MAVALRGVLPLVRRCAGNGVRRICSLQQVACERLIDMTNNE